MVRHSAWRVLVAAAIIGAFAGCDKLPWGQTAKSDLEDDEFGELGDAAADDAFKSDSEHSDSGHSSDLALKLEVGQRFPLMKTVEQRLSQSLPTGMSVGHSRLELQLSLVVEELRANRRRIGVRYHRVRYQQDLGGHMVEFNSEQPSTNVPPEALAYAGLKDNGFSFWIGADNQVLELVGFSDFLKRCVQHVPGEQRMAVLQQLQAMRTEDGLANFVDDSIGLLPGANSKSGSHLRVGSSWDLPTRLVSAGGPPAAGSTCTTRCLLKDMNDKTAEISLAGEIGPSTWLDELRRVKLTVRSGQCFGTCTVDRSTGMPTRSHVNRTLDMTAQLPDGTEIPQRKEVVTTTVAFLEQGATRSTASFDDTDREVRQTSHTRSRSERFVQQ